MKCTNIEKFMNAIKISDEQSEEIKNNYPELSLELEKPLNFIYKLKDIIRGNISDVRRKSGNYQHPIINLVLIFVLGILAGKDTIKDIYDYAKTSFHYLKNYFEIPVLLPRHLGGRNRKDMSDEEQLNFINNMDENAKFNFLLASYNTLRRSIIGIDTEEMIKVRNLFINEISPNCNELNIVPTDIELVDKPADDFLISNTVNQDSEDEFFKENMMIISKYNNYDFSGESPFQSREFYVNGAPMRICALDGKSVKATKSIINKKSAKHIISLFDINTLDVVAELEVPKKTNEITQDTKVLGKVENLENFLITADAMACQKDIAGYIDSKDAFYLLKVKKNQKALHEVCEFKMSRDPEGKIFLEIDEVNKYRLEDRKYFYSEDVESIKKEWPSVKAIFRVEKKIIREGKEGLVNDYYIANFKNKDLFVFASRLYWYIENKLHRALDCAYSEDKCRAKKGNSTLNLNVLRKLGLMVMQRAKKVINEKVTFRSLFTYFDKRPDILESTINNIGLSKKFSINKLLSKAINFFK